MDTTETQLLAARVRRTRGYRGVLILLVFELLAFQSASANQGDDTWNLRAEEMAGDLATSAQVENAILAYRLSYEADSSNLETRWKLLRAFHFLVDFSNAADERKDLVAEEAIGLAEASIESLGLSGDESFDRARLYFWSAIVWGVRAQRVGLLTIVREGAATRMRDYAETSAALDQTVEQGGALRLLSRLHASLPRVPFLTNWVDRSKALEYAEKAIALGPEHSGNQLILALAILERAPERRAQAEMILRQVANIAPARESRAEETAIRDQARNQILALEQGPN
jgi:hypothetical protein